jgi:pimeloyl-ACP methyl ester carboxylesterase
VGAVPAAPTAVPFNDLGRYRVLAYSRSGQGPALVLLHGLGHDRRVWEPVLPLITRFRDVITVDLPGHGRSPALPSRATPDLDASLAAVRSLFTELGLEAPEVAGHALGGRLALELARTRDVGSATAIAPAGFRAPAIEFAVIRSRINRMRATARQTEPLEHGSRYAPRPQPAVPVTLARGTLDTVFAARHAGRARAALPRARFVPLPGCGHVPMADNPFLVTAMLLQAAPSRGCDHVSADPHPPVLRLV